MPAKHMIAAKFGGTSVKDAERIRNVCDIVQADERRRFIVVSAPAGVTNKLIEWFESDPLRRIDIWHELVDRFTNIAADLGVPIDVREKFDQISKGVKRLRKSRWLRHYIVSRGEWLNAQIVAAALRYEYLDAKDVLIFDQKGRFSFEKTARIAECIRLDKTYSRGVVIPGFYGAVADHKSAVCTFSRGGSDITGAIIARLIGAEVYENWTDVDGVYAADPRIVENPRKNATMTYRELRELTFMGAKVFHEDAVAPVRSVGIPIHVRSTLEPSGAGTRIVAAEAAPDCRVTGIAGKNGFSLITMEKYGMDDERGILSRAASVFTKAGVSINVSSSIDSLTFIVETAIFEKAADAIMDELRAFEPDDIRVEHGIALVCTVGEGMRDTPGISAMLDTALARAQINIVLELQGGSQINIIRGVRGEHLKDAIRAIYSTFFH